MKEEWRPIEGYEGYEVSNYGRVRSVDRTIQRKDGRTQRCKGRMLKPREHEKGYLTVNPCNEDGNKNRYVHRLVLEAFVGKCPDGMETLHIDGDPTNNRVDNLRWGSSSDNPLDIIRHGHHNETSKTCCPRGHALVPGNLAKSNQRRGYRRCLACTRARRNIQLHLEIRDSFNQIADQHYEKIIQEGNLDMSTIEQLKTISSRKPRDLREWLDSYEPEEQEVIINVILNAGTHQAYESLSALQPSPYPFRRGTISHHRRILRLAGHK